MSAFLWGRFEVGILIVLLSAGVEIVKIASRGISCKCSVRWISFTLRFPIYNIINGMVAIKFSIFVVKEGYQFQPLFVALQCMVLCGGGS